jgi:hypothetical protein
MKVSRRQPYVGRSIEQKRLGVPVYTRYGERGGPARFSSKASGRTSYSCVVPIRVDGWSVGVVPPPLRGGLSEMSIWSVGVEYE